MRLILRRLDSGERFAMLVDGNGAPLCWPTLFATVRLRNSGLAVNSIKNKLVEIRTLLRWEQLHDRDLETEFREGKLLTLPDVVSIRNFAEQKVGRAPARGAANTRARFLEAGIAPSTNRAKVSKSVHYNRLTTIADYLEFVAQTVTAHRGDRGLATAVGEMATSVRNHRPRGMGSSDNDGPLSPLTELIDEFVRVGSEGHPDNPFHSKTIQRRNEIIFRVLRETGVRLGELLSLRLDSVVTSNPPSITVRRTHDDPHDPRAYQPVSKTKEGTLDISDDLARAIHRYYMEDRRMTPGARRHPYLFVTHRKGHTCGQPLSMGSVSNRVFGAMQRVRPEFSSIRPHSFRHHRNYEFSKAVDEHNRKAKAEDDPSIQPISPERELRMRGHLNRHRSLKSGEKYNRRHVQESTSEAVLREQERHWEQANRTRNDDDA